MTAPSGPASDPSIWRPASSYSHGTRGAPVAPEGLCLDAWGADPVSPASGVSMPWALLVWASLWPGRVWGPKGARISPSAHPSSKCVASWMGGQVPACLLPRPPLWFQ